MADPIIGPSREQAEAFGQQQAFINPLNPPSSPILRGPNVTPADPTGYGRGEDFLDRVQQSAPPAMKYRPGWEPLPDRIDTEKWGYRPDHEGSLIDAMAFGIRNNTLVGSIIRNQEARAQVNAERGWQDDAPDPSYDVFSDPQLKDMQDQLWRFYDSTSAFETRLRMVQLVRGAEREREIARNHAPGAAVATMAGSLVDPTTMLPATVGIARTAQVMRAIRAGVIPKLSWGVAANAAEGAALNAALVFGSQAFMATTDASETMEGVGDAMMLAGFLGAVGGASAGFAKRNHVVRDWAYGHAKKNFTPEDLQPRADAPGRPREAGPAMEINADNHPIGHKVVDSGGNEWRVVATAEGKFFLPEEVAQKARIAEAPAGKGVPVEGKPTPDADPVTGTPKVTGEAVRPIQPAGIDVSDIEPRARGFLDEQGRPIDEAALAAERESVGGGSLVDDLTEAEARARALDEANLPVGDLATGKPGFIAPILDSAPPHPLDPDSGVGMAKSVSAAIVPGSATSNLKNLLHQEALAAAGGLQALPTNPHFRNLTRKSLVVRQISNQLVDGGGAKLNKNIAGEMGLNPTPEWVLAERAQLEKQIKANELARRVLEAEAQKAILKPWSDGIYRLAPNERLPKDATGRPITPDGYDLRGRISDRIADNFPLGAKVEDEYGVVWTVEQGSGPGKHSFGHAQPNYAFEGKTEPGRPGRLETDAEFAAREWDYKHRMAVPRATPPAETAKTMGQLQVANRLIESDRARLADPELELATGRQAAEKSVVPVEAWIALRWKSLMNVTEQGYRSAWIEGRAALTGTRLTEGETKNVTRSFVQQGKDLFSGDPKLTYGAFRERVTRAAADGADRIQDGMTPYVEKAAKHYNDFTQKIADAADHPDVNLFRREAAEALEKVEQRRAEYIEKQRLKGETPHPAVLGQLDDLEAKLRKTIQHGPHQSNSKNYVTTIYRMDKIARNQEGLISIFQKWIMDSSEKAGSPIEADAAYKQARASVEKITHTKSQSLKEYADEAFEEIGNPSGVKVRTMDIPRELIEDYLENDIVMLTRYHGSQMGSAIEMTRQFGDINMTRQLQAIADDYKRLIDEEGNLRKRTELIRERDAAIEDTETLRDRLLGLEGASKDPHAWGERTIRMLKHYTSWTTMGLSALSQVADLPRIVLTEGLDATFRYAFGPLIDKNRRIIMDMVQAERLHSGDVWELGTASGSLAMANIGDALHSRTAIERMASNLTNHYFLANGLTIMTDISRTIAGSSILGNMNASILRWGEAIKKGEAFTDEKLMAKFRMLGIEGNDVLRMYNQLLEHKTQFNSIVMPQTHLWTDQGAQELYRQAFTRQVNRTIVTPGAMDLPTFMSNSVGSLLTQFKSFGVSSYNRTLVAGLQDNDRQFWIGMATLAGAGVVLNEIRNQLFYDRSSFDQPYLGVLADGIERGGGLGMVMDLNNALEVATRNKMGVRPLVGAQKNMPITPDKFMGTFLGPSVEKMATGARLLGEVMAGDATARTWREARGFVPGQNLPYTDWWFDMAFPKASSGGSRKKKQPGYALPQGAFQ